MFPLNNVLFPGVVTPLHVFEDRYRALVGHLRTLDDPAERVFGVVAIREGYEVGDHGFASVHRVGTLVQVTSVDAYEDGRFDLEVVGRHRVRLEGMSPGSIRSTESPWPVGQVESLPDTDEPGADEEAERAQAMFDRYRLALNELRGDVVLEGPLPRDPTYLSYSLAATCLLTLRERQALLEAETAVERLGMLRRSLLDEMRAMQAVPSLPATEVARTRWSPN